jgi:hypothetical protein
MHLFHVFLDVDFIIWDIACFDDCTSHGVAIGGEEVEDIINLLMLDEELNKESLEMERHVVGTMMVNINFCLKGECHYRIFGDLHQEVRGLVISTILVTIHSIHQRQMLHRN